MHARLLLGSGKAPSRRRDSGRRGTRPAWPTAVQSRPLMQELPSASPHDVPPELGESVNLVRRAQDGDREALGALVLRYQDRVRRLVRIRMGPQFDGVLDSLDLSQDTWLAAMRGLGGLQARDHSGIIAWLARIAENQVLDAADRLNTA